MAPRPRSYALCRPGVSTVDMPRVYSGVLVWLSCFVLVAQIPQGQSPMHLRDPSAPLWT